jgi:hypothetical protein
MLQPEQTQLRRAPSVGTNASGVAESVVDAESLAHFPPPPDDIPLTPLRDYVPSPSRSVFGRALPATHNRKHFRIPLSASGSAASHRTYPSNASSASHRTFPQNEYGPIPLGSPLRPSRLGDDIADTPLSNKSEWHEGSSKIIVGRAEERMLSTSFITDLLSFEDTTTSNVYPRPSTNKNHPPSYIINDEMSVFPELTYPPPSGLIRTAPPDIDISHRSSPLQLQDSDYSQSSQPPESFLALDADGRSIVGTNGTLDGFEQNGASVIRTASKSRKLGARGASVVGFAQATLRTVSLTLSGPSSNNASTISNVGKGQASASSTPGPGDEGDAQRLTIPDFHGPSPMLYSPAQRSSGDFRNSDVHTNSRPQHKVRYSIQSTKTTKSFASSFIPRFSVVPSTAPRSSRSIKEAVSSWFRLKPLPRLPVHPDMSIAAEAEFRKADDALPLPELVNRAEALQGMLEKGYRPHSGFNHNNFNSTSTTNKGRYDFDREVPITSAWEGPSERKNSTSIMANVTRFFAHGGSGGDSNQGQRYGPNIKRVPMTKKQRVIVIGCIAMLILASILGIGLGTGLAKKKQKLPNCPGNFTGNACNLGE